MNETIEKTKLAGVLKTFDKANRLAARRFLESPYFNSSKELVRLYNEILKFIEKDRPLYKVKLWKKAVGNTPYNDLRFRKYCSDLSKLMERFLVQQALEEDEIQQKILLLRRMNDTHNRADKIANSTAGQATKLLEEYPYRDSSYYLYHYQLQKQLYDLQNFDTKRGVKSNIEKISDFLDWFYIGEKLRLITEAESRTKLKAHSYNISFKDEIFELAQHNLGNFQKLPHIIIYYQIFQILSEEEADENYFELKKLIEENAKFFPRDIAVDELYGAAQNYCVKRVNLGNVRFLEELFELFNLLIDQELIISDGNISPWYFRNIVFVGLRLGKYDWTEAFILKYQDFLPESLRTNAVTFNLAQLYFYQKKYHQVIRQLQFVEYDDISYNLNSKAILMATYYEIDEIEPLESLLEAFRSYLTRNRSKIPEARNKSFMLLIRFLRTLVRLRPGDSKALQKLKNNIIERRETTSRAWLLEKIAELE